MTNAFLQSLKTAFVDPFKKFNSQTPTMPTLKTSVNNLMSVAPKQSTPFYPTPTGKPIVPKTPAPNMSTVNGPAYGGAPQVYNSQTLPLLQANVGPSTFANVKSTAPVVKPTVPTITAPKTTSAGAMINAATGGVVPSPTIPNGGAPMTTPTLPEAPNPLESAVSEAEKTYRGNLAQTPEEIAAEEELSRLSEGFKKSYQNTADQTIPLEFITGQQKSIENRALNLAEPLKDKLARLQAKRTSALEASKFALDRADSNLKAEKDKVKPTTVSSGESVIQFNPKTGQYESLYTGAKGAGEGFSLSAGQTRYDANGNPIATATDPEKKAAEEARGKASQNVLDIVDTLIGSDTNAISGVPSIGAFLPGSNAQKTKNLYNQLKGMLSLENRSQLKGSGAISDFEFKVLEQAATSLGRNLSDADFRSTLNTLRKDLADARAKSLASSGGGNTGGNVVTTTIGPINTNW